MDHYRLSYKEGRAIFRDLGRNMALVSKKTLWMIYPIIENQTLTLVMRQLPQFPSQYLSSIFQRTLPCSFHAPNKNRKSPSCCILKSRISHCFLPLLNETSYIQCDCQGLPNGRWEG